jgi:glutathione S-transferase
MVTLYHAPSTAALVVHWLLIEIEMPHQLHALDPEMSIVDFFTTMPMCWSRNMPRPTDGWPVLGTYAQRMKALPSFRETYAREGLTDWT